MQVLTGDLDKCIVCRSSDARNMEHIIPEALGGRLRAPVLCTHCNSTFGHALVANLVSDPGVVLAINNLKSDLPKLHNSITRNHRYVAPGPDGMPIEIRKGKLRTRTTRDNTLLMESGVAAKHLRAMLAARGVSHEEVNLALEGFERLEDGVEHDVGMGLAVRRTTITSVEADLSSGLVDDRWPALVALEFLALNVGSLVLNEVCDPIRDYVQGSDRPEGLVVERFFDRGYEPRHGMYWSPSSEQDDFYDFNLRLFGAIVFRIQVKYFRLRGPMAAYVEELQSGKSLLSQNGLHGPFFIMNPDP